MPIPKTILSDVGPKIGQPISAKFGHGGSTLATAFDADKAPLFGFADGLGNETPGYAKDDKLDIGCQERAVAFATMAQVLNLKVVYEPGTVDGTATPSKR